MAQVATPMQLYVLFVPDTATATVTPLRNNIMVIHGGNQHTGIVTYRGINHVLVHVYLSCIDSVMLLTWA